MPSALFFATRRAWFRLGRNQIHSFSSISRSAWPSCNNFGNWSTTLTGLAAFGAVVALCSIDARKSRNKYCYVNCDGAPDTQDSLEDDFDYNDYFEFVVDEGDDESYDDSFRLKYSYIVIGSGTTASAAITSILNIQADADILLLSSDIGDESDREEGEDDEDEEKDESKIFATLSDDLKHSYSEWRRDTSNRMQKPIDKSTDVTVQYNKALKIEPDKHRVLLDDGYVYYDKCLVSMPGVPKQLVGLKNALSWEPQNVNQLLDVKDFEMLDMLKDMEDVRHVTVVGGGYLGTEIALTLASRGLKISHVYPEMVPMQMQLPTYLAKHIKKKLKLAGVEPISESFVKDLAFNPKSNCVELHLQGKKSTELPTDYIVVGATDIVHSLELAESSDFEIDGATGGVLVNAQFEAIGGVYIAGGAASYYDVNLGRRRVDRYDHSVNSGLLAGFNMATSLNYAQCINEFESLINEDTFDAPTDNENDDQTRAKMLPCSYAHQPMFRSFMRGIGVCMEGVGVIDSRLETVGIWLNTQETHETDAGATPEPSYKRGIIYYMQGSKVVGILLWNAGDLLVRAREVLRVQPTIKSMAQLKDCILLAPSHWLRISSTPGVFRGHSTLPLPAY